MIRLRFLVIASLLSCTLTMMGAQIGHPVPPGVREADKLPNPADIPPQVTPKQRPPDRVQIHQHAQELTKLADLIPSEVQEVENGRLPKDLEENLKRIEKLSKQLRREISR
jgi:hypothetical protein